MDGATDVPIAYLLVENQTEAITTFAILSRCGKRMELWFNIVFLGAKAQALRQRQLQRVKGKIDLYSLLTIRSTYVLFRNNANESINLQLSAVVKLCIRKSFVCPINCNHCKTFLKQMPNTSI